jgi:hypothetical protein
LTVASTVACRCTTHVVHADLLERLLEADLLVVDRDALLAQRRGDVAGRDRAEQVAFGAGAAFDRDRGFASFWASSFIERDALLLLGHGRGARTLDGGDVALRDHDGEAARQQVVAGVARLDLDHVAEATEVLDVLLQQEFHVTSSPRTASGRRDARA